MQVDLAPETSMSISNHHAARNAIRITGAILVAALSATLRAQSIAAPKPWHLSAPQLATECRAAIADMRATVDAAVKRPPAQQTFANGLRPIEEANGRLASRTNMLASLLYLSPDKAVRDSSTACSQLVSNYAVEVQADPRIYAAALEASKEQLPPIDHALDSLKFRLECYQRLGSSLHDWLTAHPAGAGVVVRG